MRRPQIPASRGSQKWLQILVNNCPELLNQTIAEQSNTLSHQIHWLSPHRDDDYAEYSDDSFVDILEVTLDKVPRKSFWPNGGPVWDGLGKTDQGELLLVEAKAHVPELVSGPTGAKEPSLSKIRTSLEATKQFIGSQTKVDWSTCLYQYANRLAHLYLLRELNGLPAFLIFLYFVDAEDMNGPKTRAEWESAILLEELLLGVRRHKLSEYIIHTFVDTKQIQSALSK